MIMQNLFWIIIKIQRFCHNGWTNNVAWNFYLSTLQIKTLLTQITQLCLERYKKKKNSQNTDTLANIYYKLGDFNSNA